MIQQNSPDFFLKPCRDFLHRQWTPNFVQNPFLIIAFHLTYLRAARCGAFLCVCSVCSAWGVCCWHHTIILLLTAPTNGQTSPHILIALPIFSTIFSHTPTSPYHRIILIKRMKRIKCCVIHKKYYPYFRSGDDGFLFFTVCGRMLCHYNMFFHRQWQRTAMYKFFRKKDIFLLPYLYSNTG